MLSNSISQVEVDYHSYSALNLNKIKQFEAHTPIFSGK